MSRKQFGFGLVYSLLLVAVTAAITAQVATPTAAEAITQLNKEYRTDPAGKHADVAKAIQAATFLEGAVLEHDVLAHAEEGLQLHKDNEAFLQDTHVLLNSIRKELGSDTCPACGDSSLTDQCACPDQCNCTGKCDCSQKHRQIPEETEPVKVIEVRYNRNVEPLAPSIN